MNINEINSGVLAYIGDAVYELEIRNYLVLGKINKVDKLQKKAIDYVSAPAQAKILENLLNSNVLSEEELEVVKRARNYKPNSKPKHSDIKTYKKATALEALFGMLYIQNKQDRIKEIMKVILRW